MKLLVSLFIALICAIVVPSVANADSPVYVASKGCPTGSFDFAASLSDESGGLYLDLYNDTDNRIVLPVRWHSYELCDINFYTVQDLKDAVEQDIEWQWLLGMGLGALVIVGKRPVVNYDGRELSVGRVTWGDAQAACIRERMEQIWGGSAECYEGEYFDLCDGIDLTCNYYTKDVQALLWPGGNSRKTHDRDSTFISFREMEQALYDACFAQQPAKPEWWECDGDAGGRYVR